MPSFRLLFLLIGAALFGFLLWSTDLGSALGYIGDLGWGLLPVLTIYVGAFAVDTLSWQLVLGPARLDWSWFAELWKIRLVGMAVNQVTPVVGLAGEPLKAMLLKRRLGIGYREGGASLFVAKTANLVALVVFLTGGVLLALAGGRLPPDYRVAVAVGLGVLVVGIGAVFAAQRLRAASRLGGLVGRARWGRRLVHLLESLEAFDDHLVEAYTTQRRRFLLATLLTLVNWALGAVELYAILRFMGEPVSLAYAWSLQSVVELVRAATFFIPASLGAQEGILVLMLAPLSGGASLGLAVALIKRFRELLWIGAGLATGWIAFPAASDRAA
ncbi:conserved hypothetical protein [Tistlia consotensis]|uniref:Lysylphosphatidylglycerol synthase TM region n=1 Tax=Tistlia consotensis USBA 355 TaxID=560819 RepID=A0A1Y6BFV4_9PROT|nr:lysylphosphatidylglycerol synthase transmembrane domain-containing protein [Tistlia consotensis]SMF01871.1 conserved hypothetical protein [Tistlia consotensis USBA 355]SNS37541.1 conserved hypothetical protein [Tistlia consotensis]